MLNELKNCKKKCFLNLTDKKQQLSKLSNLSAILLTFPEQIFDAKKMVAHKMVSKYAHSNLYFLINNNKSFQYRCIFTKYFL